MDTGKERKEKNVIYVQIHTTAAKRKEIFIQSQSVTHTHTALAFYYIVLMTTQNH